MSEYIFGIATKALIMKENKILFIYKTDKEAEGGRAPNFKRDHPGGRLEFGETPICALKREVMEEVGLNIEVICPVNTWTFSRDRFQLVGIDFLCEYISGEIVLSEEHESFEWMDINDIKAEGWSDISQYLRAFDIFNNWYKYEK